MRRFLIIIGLLFAFGNVASPSMAATSVATATVQAGALDSNASCLMPTEKLTKAATFKPCTKKINGKAVLPCHLPPMIIPAEIVPILGSGVGSFDTPVQCISPSMIFADQFRPPRLAGL